jgi:hypothetical protein
MTIRFGRFRAIIRSTFSRKNCGEGRCGFFFGNLESSKTGIITYENVAASSSF